jgi:hypothetical protein
MQIYINKNNQQLGPFNEAKVLEMLRNGQLSPNDYGIKQGHAEWQKLEVLFPQPRQAANLPINKPPQVVPNVQFNNQMPPTPQKSGGSKGLMFGLIGCGGLILLSVIGAIGFFALSKKNAVSDDYSSNKSNSNTAANTLIPTDFTAIKAKADELAKLSPPLKPDSKAKLKGKIAFVQTDKNGSSMYGFNYDFTKLEENPYYGLKPEIMAKTPAEIDSLIQINCRKGKFVGRYDGNISGYGNDCKVSLIDYRHKTIFAQKSFSNNKAEKSVSSVYDGGDYIMPSPIEAINNFIEPFIPEKIEVTASDAASLPSFEDKAEFAKNAGDKLGVISFALKLDENAKIKGKLAVIETDSSSMLIGIDRDGNLSPPLPDSIGLTKERLNIVDAQLATKTSEIETLIQVNCKRGTLITKVKGISVFSNVCTVNIIDYKALAITAQKVIEGKKVDNNRYTDPAIYNDKTDNVEFPRTEIEEYIKQFPKS